MIRGSTEWWRGWILLREGERAVLGVQHTSSGIIIRRYPRLRWVHAMLQLALAAVTIAVLWRTAHLPSPRASVVFAVWIVSSLVVSRALPELSRAIVLDAEHLYLESGTFAARSSLFGRADLAEIVAVDDALFARHRGRLERLALRGMTPDTATTIARLLNEELAEPAKLTTGAER